MTSGERQYRGRPEGPFHADTPFSEMHNYPHSQYHILDRVENLGRSADAIQQKINPAYALREKLYAAIKQKVGILTLDAVIDCINNGIGEEFILELQRVGRTEDGGLHLAHIFPGPCITAILAYTPRPKAPQNP